MAHDEDQLAALALSGVLTSAMLRASEEGRRFLYCWERDGLQWLVRFRDRRPDGVMDSNWMPRFLALNREAIMAADDTMDFNLRAARLAQAKS